MKCFIYGCVILCLLISCEEIVSVPDISEDMIEVIAPASGAVLEEGNITFSWEELEFANEYQLQIATPNFTEAAQVVVDTIVGDSLQSSRNLTRTLSPEIYQWRIRGLNDNFETDYTTRNLEVLDTQAPLSEEVVTILTPEDNLETEETVITFSWEEIATATQYRILITDTADGSVFVEETTTDLEITIDFIEGSYEYAIRAENDTENSPYTTQSLEVLSTQPPLSDEVLIILTPEDNLETSETSILFSWEALETANLYRILITDTADGSVFMEQTTTDLELIIDLVPGVYEYSIRAENVTENSPFTIQTITIL